MALGTDDGHELLAKVSPALVLLQISHARLFDTFEGALEVAFLYEMFCLPVSHVAVHSGVVWDCGLFSPKLFNWRSNTLISVQKDWQARKSRSRLSFPVGKVDWSPKDRNSQTFFADKVTKILKYKIIYPWLTDCDRISIYLPTEPFVAWELQTIQTLCCQQRCSCWDPCNWRTVQRSPPPSVLSSSRSACRHQTQPLSAGSLPSSHIYFWQQILNQRLNS